VQAESLHLVCCQLGWSVREIKSDLYWDYWRLGLRHPDAAEVWYNAHRHLSFWDDLPLVCPGFYRGNAQGWRQRKLPSSKYAVAIWITTPLDENGEAAGDSYYEMQCSHRQDVSTDEYDITKHFHKVRHDPVSEAACRYCMLHGVWSDTIPDKESPSMIEATQSEPPF